MLLALHPAGGPENVDEIAEHFCAGAPVSLIGGVFAAPQLQR